MGKDPKKAILDEHARRFLECAAAGARGKDLSGPLEPLRPAMDKMIGKVHARWSLRVPYAEPDLRQDVYERLLRKPPTKTGGSFGPAATVCAWVKNTTQRLLIDKNKSARGRIFIAYNDKQVYGDAEDRIDALGRVERLDALAAFLRMLEKESPAVHQYFRTLLENPSLSTEELAGILRKKVENVHKLHSRLREYALMFNEMTK